MCLQFDDSCLLLWHTMIPEKPKSTGTKGEFVFCVRSVTLFAKMFQILSKMVNFWTDTHRKTTFLFSRKNEICLMKWTLLVRKTRTFVPKTSYFRAVFIFHKKVYFCFTGSSCIQNTQKLLNLSKNVLFWTKCVSFLKNTPRINCLDFWKNRYSLENTWNPHGILRL